MLTTKHVAMRGRVRCGHCTALAPARAHEMRREGLPGLGLLGPGMITCPLLTFVPVCEFSYERAHKVFYIHSSLSFQLGHNKMFTYLSIFCGDDQNQKKTTKTKLHQERKLTNTHTDTKADNSILVEPITNDVSSIVSL